MTARFVLPPDSEFSKDLRRWALSAAIVVAAHGGLAAGYILMPPETSQGAPQAPSVIMDMAPTPVAPASQVDLAPGPDMVEAQPPPDQPPPPEPEVLDPLPKIEAPAVVTLPIQEPKPKPPDEQPVEKPETKPDAPKIEQQTPAPRTTAAPRSDTQTAPVPRAPSVGSVQEQAALANWRDLVVARLQQAKRYPSTAEANREQGTVTLSFSVDRNGRVLARNVARGSGYSALDQEVMALILRAQPLPPFPPIMQQQVINLTVPIRFSLR